MKITSDTSIDYTTPFICPFSGETIVPLNTVDLNDPHLGRVTWWECGPCHDFHIQRWMLYPRRPAHIPAFPEGVRP